MTTPAGAPGVYNPPLGPAPPAATAVPTVHKEEAYDDIPIAQPVNMGQGGAPTPGMPYNQGGQYPGEQFPPQTGYPPQPAPPPGYGGHPGYGFPPPGYGPGLIPPQQQFPPQYKAGMVPENAIVGPPGNLPLAYTFFGDTEAPYHCKKCGKNGLSRMEHHFSLAACLGCVVTLVGVCFLLPSCDCLWSKTHYCIHCGEKVGVHDKSDPCLVADPPNYTKLSYAVPASGGNQ
ncbi:LITAF-domain-containing protein [Klebsormidium nitens]|uniref:LITAF-domain-containing protein n=1 Tax=Klebsormidium nitens TaxID=105231 RepID=A0A0U9HTN1_KLENI|nr:LITAF-domain-containing protein [Klebsormidium nitens]|eukprot:GAQ79424.1 LITAF-domain-containing protein [Klebsormidium nitens]